MTILETARLRHLVEVWTLAPEIRNAAGGITIAGDSNYRLQRTNVRAGLEPLPGQERFTDGRLQSDATHRVVMRSSVLTRGLRPRDMLIHVNRDKIRIRYDLMTAFDVDDAGVMMRATAKVRPNPT
jgi:hypothetical protein